MNDAVRVYVVTYRRPTLLRRALESLLRQTHKEWTAEVINDDPGDPRVDAVIAELGDPRIELARPAIHRGATENFNRAFRGAAERFASILEDDNWWEPTFLATMLDALRRHPDISVACANERIWREETDGGWTDTGRTIWETILGESRFEWTAQDKCGQAKLCNSSLVFRTAESEQWKTPATIPVDVTEHFRERVVPHPLLLVHSPLVNYAETLTTNRSSRPGVWGSYQVLLIGSVFAGCSSTYVRRELAAKLWRRARTHERPLATSLLATGCFVTEARDLWHFAGVVERARFVAAALRHPIATLRVAQAQRRHKAEWQWLLEAIQAGESQR